MKMKHALLILSLVLLIGVSTAQTTEETSISDLDTVIITSSANYPDAFISGPVSEMIGAPVLVTGKGNLSESISQTLEDAGAEEAILVGGPSVLSKEVEEDINTKVNSTTRLWGTTQTGTSIEVSKYFWTSNQEATVAQYPQDSENGYKTLSRIAEKTEGEPLLISKEGTLSASVVSELERLNATEVEVFSTNATNVTEDLESIGVEEIEVEEEETEDLAREETPDNSSRMVLVAASGFRDAIPSSSSQGKSLIISSQREIEDALERVRNSSAEKVYVTGKPDLAETISSRLENETDKEISLLSGPPEQASANIFSEQRSEWVRDQENKIEKWRNRNRNAKGLEISANITIRNDKSVIDENSSENVRERIEEAIERYQNGNYFTARKIAAKAHSMARSRRFRGKTGKEIREDIERERQDLKSAAKELRKMGRKQAERLGDAETAEERLEIIEEFKKKRNLLKPNRADKKQERRRGHAPDIVGSSKLKMDVEGEKVKAEAGYTAPTGGHKTASEVEKSNSSVKFDFRISPPSGPATQVLTDLSLEEGTTLEPGNYTATLTLSVEEKKVDHLSREIVVPSSKEFESEFEDSDDESNGAARGRGR